MKKRTAAYLIDIAEQIKRAVRWSRSRSLLFRA